MNLYNGSILPKNFKHPGGAIQVSPRLVRIAGADQAEVFAELKTGESGLSAAEAHMRQPDVEPDTPSAGFGGAAVGRLHDPGAASRADHLVESRVQETLGNGEKP
jgi:hypothetical protein